MGGVGGLIERMRGYVGRALKTGEFAELVFFVVEGEGEGALVESGG